MCDSKNLSLLFILKIVAFCDDSDKLILAWGLPCELWNIIGLCYTGLRLF